MTEPQQNTYCYPYPRPAVTVDAVVFRKRNTDTEVLLIQRINPPFQGGWALPGGFIDMNETAEEAVVRELREETGLIDVGLEQLHTFSAINRDPRGRTLSVIFWGVMHKDLQATAGDDAGKVEWFNILSLPELAFDHCEVIAMAITRLKNKL